MVQTGFGASAVPEICFPPPLYRQGNPLLNADLFDLILGVITGIHQHFLVIISCDNHRLTQISGDHACTVVLGGGVVDLSLTALHNGIHHLDHLGCKGTCVLEHGHGLFTAEHVLNICNVTVLACDDRIGPRVGGCQGIFHTQCSGVIGAEHCIQHGAV